MKKALLLCLFLASLTSYAQKTKIQFEEYTLPNGLHVILHQDKSTPIVAVTVMYHVGSKNENPQRTGFAHFFEHLLFEGSENIARGQFDVLNKNAGGENNANTTQDRTYYYQILPSNQLELGLWMESERMLHAKIDQVGVDTQREVVKEEKRQRIDNQPYGSILTETLTRAYTQHPYRWAPIGSLEHLNAATLDEFMAFYKQFYVPNNAILSIAGDIDMKQTRAMIDKYFREVPRGQGEVYRPQVTEPVRQREVRDTIYDNIQLPAVIQAYHMPAQGTEDYYAMDMLNTLLSDGESSRFNKEIKDREQKAVYVGSIPLALEDPGLFLTLGITNMGVDPKDLENSMDREITRVKNELVTEREFQKLKNQIENDFVSRNARVVGIAESLANYKMYFGDANLINTEIERYNKVTRQDLQRVARKYLVPTNRVVLHYLPKASQNQNTAAGAR